MPAITVGGHFSLIDHHGHAVTDEDYLGRYVLVFFGFTHCREICPAVLGRNSAALEQLGGQADHLYPLYITVDPERDTPAVMRDYLRDRHPRYIGLTGGREQVDAAKTAYRVFTRSADDPHDPSGYALPHTAFTFLMGPDGNYLTHFTETVSAAEMATTLRDILQEGNVAPAAHLEHGTGDRPARDCCS